MSILRDMAVSTKNLLDTMEAKRAEHMAAQDSQKGLDKITLSEAFSAQTEDRLSTSKQESLNRMVGIAAAKAEKEIELGELLGVEGAEAGTGSIFAIIKLAENIDAGTIGYHATTAANAATARAAYIASVGNVDTDFVL